MVYELQEVMILELVGDRQNKYTAATYCELKSVLMALLLFFYVYLLTYFIITPTRALDFISTSLSCHVCFALAGSS